MLCLACEYAYTKRTVNVTFTKPSLVVNQSPSLTTPAPASQCQISCLINMSRLAPAYGHNYFTDTLCSIFLAARSDLLKSTLNGHVNRSLNA